MNSKSTESREEIDDTKKRSKKPTSAILYKTRLCPFLSQNEKCSRGRWCLFAHVEEECRGAPNLHKTKMCPQLSAKGDCSKSNEDCPYAHSQQELRHTDNLYKTKYCHMFKKGRCTAGDMCRHAHGPKEYLHYRKVANTFLYNKNKKNKAPNCNQNNGSHENKEKALSKTKSKDVENTSTDNAYSITINDLLIQILSDLESETTNQNIMTPNASKHDDNKNLLLDIFLNGTNNSKTDLDSKSTEYIGKEVMGNNSPVASNFHNSDSNYAMQQLENQQYSGMHKECKYCGHDPLNLSFMSELNERSFLDDNFKSIKNNIISFETDLRPKQDDRAYEYTIKHFPWYKDFEPSKSLTLPIERLAYSGNHSRSNPVFDNESEFSDLFSPVAKNLNLFANNGLHQKNSLFSMDDNVTYTSNENDIYREKCSSDITPISFSPTRYSFAFGGPELLSERIDDRFLKNNL